MKIVLSAHAVQMIEKRKMLEHEAFDTVRNPDNIRKEYAKYYYQKKFARGTIEAVCERTANHIKIITIYWL